MWDNPVNYVSSIDVYANVCSLLFVMGYEHAEGGLQELSWCVVSHATVTSVRNSLALSVEMQWQEDWEYATALISLLFFCAERFCWEVSVLYSFSTKSWIGVPTRTDMASALFQLTSLQPQFSQYVEKNMSAAITGLQLKLFEGLKTVPVLLGFNCGSSLWVL